MQQALDAGESDNITVVLVEIAALGAETLPEEAVPPSAQDLTQTRRFEVPPEKIAAQQEAQRKKWRKELRREIWMIVLVTLAVLALVGGILYVSLFRSIQNARSANTPAPEPEHSTAPVQAEETMAPVQSVEPAPEIHVDWQLPSIPHFEVSPEAEAEL